MVGCGGGGGLQITGEASEAFAQYKAAYIVASEEYNKSLKKYLDVFDTMPLEVQREWKETIDPLFLSASDVLNAWEKHILTGTFIPSDEDEWLTVKDKLFYMLMQQKIKEMEQ
jgi:hypothetical protein